MSFRGELKRRKVFQVAAVYAVVAWLLVQIVATVEGPLGLPDWFDTGVIVLLAVGFPVAVILSWAFDLTPDGIKSPSDGRRSEETIHPRGQRLSHVMQSLVLFAVAFLVVDQYVIEPRATLAERSTPSAFGEQPYVIRFEHSLPENQAFRNPGWPLMAVSPDGSQFVYNTEDGLYLRTMGELEARLISGTEPVMDTIAFSPDGQAVAYWAIDRQLKTIALSGGAPVTIADAAVLYGLSWQTADTIVVGLTDGIYRVPATGGTPELIIPNEDDTLVYGPRLLPDGDSVLFSVGMDSQWDAADIVVQSLSTGERTVLIQGGSDARYVSTGHLIYAFGDELFAVAFDLDNLTVSGGPVPLVQGVMRSSNGRTGVANYGVSENGTLVYAVGTGAEAVQRTLVWVDRAGHETPVDAPPRIYTYPRVSPDGTKVALDVRDADHDIWTWDFVRETLTRLTFNPGEDEFPLWSPDGQRIAYSSDRNGGGVFWQAADGAGSAELLADSVFFPSSFLPDSSGILAFGDTGASDDIAILRLGDEERVTPLLETAAWEELPDISPDGRFFTYALTELGAPEIFVRSFPDINAGVWQVSVDGGQQPVWSRNGRELFYRNGEALMAVSIETDPTFRAGNPEVVFEDEYFLGPRGRTYDVSPDGERFLMIRLVADPSATSRLIVVQNWFEELSRLAPLSE